MKVSMTLIRLVARPMLASTFIYGGIYALQNTAHLAEASKPVNDEIRGLAGKIAPQLPVPSDDKTMVRLNAGVHILAGLGLATGRAPRLSALALAGTVVPTTLAGHRFWEAEGATKQAQLIHFLKNLGLLGGLLLAAVDTEGKPSVGYRARRAAHKAADSTEKSFAKAQKRAAKAQKQAKKTAKKQAKKVKS